MEEKYKYQIANSYNSNNIAIDWEKLPEKVLDYIPGDYYYNIPSYSKRNGVGIKTVIFFRKVSKFRKGIREIEHDGIIFGV
jgi:hypothetical protein